MIIDWIFLSFILSAVVILLWVHFGKGPSGEEFSYRFKICTCWICLAIIGIINVLDYIIGPDRFIVNLIIGLVAFIEITAEACSIVCRIDRELEESEEVSDNNK